MIDEVTKQKIIDTAHIVDVVSDFVSLRRAGVDYIGLCPFHADRRPSFHVSPSKNICKCFSCGEGGTPVSFLMKLEKMTFPEALRYLARKYGIPLEEREESPEERERRNQQESMYLVQKFAAEYFGKQLLEGDEGRSIALSYFHSRGVTEEVIEKFQLGYAPSSHNALLTAATQAGYNAKYLYATGLCFEPSEGRSGGDRFRERIMFPVHSVSGRIVAFGGRIMGKSDKMAKYINSPENIIYSKSRELYGLYFAKKAIAQKDKVYLVEGYMDVIAMHQAGIENVVASSGTALTREQIRLIRRFSKNISVLYDGDAAGIKAAIRGIDLLLEAGMHIRVLVLPAGEDPDSFSRSRTIDEFNDYISEHEVDFITFKTGLFQDDMASSPGRRAAVINDLVHSIGLIPDTIERSVYAQSVAQTLHIDEELLLRQVKIARSNHLMGRATEEQARSRQAALQEERRRNEEKEHEEDTPLSETEDEDLPSDTHTLPDIPPTRQEIELLRLIIRYGERLIPIDNGDGTQSDMPLALYIYEWFGAEEIEKSTPLFQKIVNESIEQLSTSESFRPAHYFANHPEPRIADLTLDLLSDRYQLSRAQRQALGIYNEDNSPELDTIINESLHAIDALRVERILQEIEQCRQSLSDAQQHGDGSQIMTLLQRINELNLKKKEIAERLGGITILPH